MGRYKSYLAGVENDGGGSRPLLDNVQKKEAVFMSSLSLEGPDNATFGFNSCFYSITQF